MDADTIGAAAAMEAFKQTAAAAGSSNAPAGAFQVGKASGGPSSKLGRAAREEEEEEDGPTAARAGASGGMQDKLVRAVRVRWCVRWLRATQMALAMSQAGKLFDKKNAGSNASGGDKAQGECYFDVVSEHLTKVAAQPCNRPLRARCSFLRSTRARASLSRATCPR